MIKGIHHIEICVADMKSAIEFYSKLIGLKVIKNTSSFSESCWLELGSQQLHLTPFANHRGHEEQHFAIEVDDIAKYQVTFKSKRMEVIKAVEIPGLHRFFVFDPFGNRIEFVQVLKNMQSY